MVISCFRVRTSVGMNVGVTIMARFYCRFMGKIIVKK